MVYKLTIFVVALSVLFIYYWPWTFSILNPVPVQQQNSREQEQQQQEFVLIAKIMNCTERSCIKLVMKSYHTSNNKLKCL